MTTMAEPQRPATIRLDGKRALITGATKGIGADIARAFAAAGASLVLSGRDVAALESVGSALSNEFGARSPRRWWIWLPPTARRTSPSWPTQSSTGWTSW